MPHTRSPFRYPGGKSQLSNYIITLLFKNKINGTYIEPFAGGAGIAIDLLLSGNVKRIAINDYDTSIYSVWYAILNDTDMLINMISSVPFDYTVPNAVTPKSMFNFWKKQKDTHEQSDKSKYSIENAFATLMLNRMNISGVINGGPIGGKSQSGKYKVDSRFNKKTLINKIRKISEQRDNILLYNLDANEFINVIKKSFSPDNTFIFFDPPYFVQGKNLYMSFFDDKQHDILAKNILSLKNYYWITTYDHAPQIFELYKHADKQYEYSLNYSAKKRGKALEYLFASHITEIPFLENMSTLQV
ncbi:DNA adenine methylase [Fructobacillus cardui]|uniref:DNA adenine methylase n=1 Tax=Fructobacillus cardui TaxID=2893170 RepID=UPI00200A9AD8|nr:DNA adenine methylase [Fructobacillus cardui]MCK8627446.1 DNA adenine methylase [Fructobacillus cardui]